MKQYKNKVDEEGKVEISHKDKRRDRKRARKLKSNLTESIHKCKHTI